MGTLTTQQMIENYFLATTEAVGTLYAKRLYGQTLILIYSTIDICGLLDAPPEQNTATGESFRRWVKKYMFSYPEIEYNEFDLWAARCSILHTFTSESELSRAGKARELVYYSADKTKPDAQHLISFTKNAQNGRYLAVHFGNLCEAFLNRSRNSSVSWTELC